MSPCSLARSPMWLCPHPEKVRLDMEADTLRLDYALKLQDWLQAKARATSGPRPAAVECRVTGYGCVHCFLWSVSGGIAEKAHSHCSSIGLEERMERACHTTILKGPVAGCDGFVASFCLLRMSTVCEPGEATGLQARPQTGAPKQGRKNPSASLSKTVDST
jgi:hypothetical protein